MLHALGAAVVVAVLLAAWEVIFMIAGVIELKKKRILVFDDVSLPRWMLVAVPVGAGVIAFVLTADPSLGQLFDS